MRTHFHALMMTKDVKFLKNGHSYVHLAIRMTVKLKPRTTLWKVLFILGGLSPLLGIAGLVGIALFGALPDTEALANPRTDLATKIYTMDGNR